MHLSSQEEYQKFYKLYNILLKSVQEDDALFMQMFQEYQNTLLYNKTHIGELLSQRQFYRTLAILLTKEKEKLLSPETHLLHELFPNTKKEMLKRIELPVETISICVQKAIQSYTMINFFYKEKYNFFLKKYKS